MPSTSIDFVRMDVEVRTNISSIVFVRKVSFLVLIIVAYQGSPIGFVVNKMALGEELKVFVDLTSQPIGISVEHARF